MGVNLSRTNLNNAELIAADLRNASLVGAELWDADLKTANLSEANASSAVFGRACLHFANFSGAKLEGAHFGGTYSAQVNFSHADMGLASFDDAMLWSCDFSNGNLICSKFQGADLMRADFRHADLRDASLIGASLYEANLTGADLSNADLTRSSLVMANLTDAILDGCSIFGISAWRLELKGAQQKNLVIGFYDEPLITVYNLEVAQFIYLLLNNARIRDVIDAISSKVVLLLGRFTEERKKILDAIREELRKRDYLPILFDFEKPTSRDITETISILAHMAHFVIADITDAKSIPQEQQRIVPDLPSVPVQPLLLASQHEYGMFEHFKRFPWVLGTYLYETKEELLANIKECVIEPAERKLTALANNHEHKTRID